MTQLNSVDEHIFIDGIGLAGYRSFGKKIQRIGPFSKINLFVGQNNSGKSNILRFLSEKFAPYWHGGGNPLRIVGKDLHQGMVENDVIIEFARSMSRIKYWINNNQLHIANAQLQIIEKVLEVDPHWRETENIWAPLDISKNIGHIHLKEEQVNLIIHSDALNKNDWSLLWHNLTNQSHGDLKTHWIPQSLRHLVRLDADVKNIRMIPAVRDIREGKLERDNFDGRGLIPHLAMLQDPVYHDRSEKEKFEKITDFAKTITGKNALELNIPYDRQTINVHADGRWLPIESLGTGVSEVIILAAAATVFDQEVLCIEEPEIHLHPILQRKLIHYLYEQTTNQYFIATHSGHLVDTPFAAVFHVELRDGASYVSTTKTPQDRFNTCIDLGCRNSDLLQSNCVIWVEGPSDRIYLNHWIQSKNPDLIEGIHYSIMFYGGRLLSHLSADDPEVTQFISLRKINRNLAVVIDSDKKSAKSNLNETKTRVSDEIENGEGLVWITAGREIENYIPHSVLSDAVESVAEGAGEVVKKERYTKVLPIASAKNKRTVDKIKVARAVAAQDADFDMLDLNDQIEKLVQFIQNANKPD